MSKTAKHKTIHIAFDRQNEQYVAYNTLTGIFVTGICVQSVSEKYCKEYFKKFGKA